MMPHLPPGGAICVDCAPSLRPRLGDIIVFREEDRLVAHRLLLRLRLGRRCYLYQKGDAARVGRWVPEARLVGVVTSATGAGGEPVYLRGAGPGAQRGRVYRQLLRDLRARGRLLLRTVAGRGADRGEARG